MVPEGSAFEFDMAIDKLINLIPGEFIKSGSRTIRSEIHDLLLLVGIRRNCLRSGRNRSLYPAIRRTTNQIIVIIGTYQFC